MHSNYFEAILQIRPLKKDIIRFVETTIKKTDKATLTKSIHLKEGVDYYLTSWKFTVALGNTLVKHFGGEVNVARKIFGKVDGKTVYRSSVLYKPSLVEVKDAIVVNNKVFLVTSVGKTITGKNLTTMKKEKIDIKQGFEKLEKHKTVVSVIYPEQEILSPEDYQNIKLVNPGKHKEGEKVVVVMHKGYVYLVG